MDDAVLGGKGEEGGGLRGQAADEASGGGEAVDKRGEQGGPPLAG